MATTSAAPRPPLHIGPIGKSAISGLTRTTAVSVKSTVANDFASLDDFVVVTKNPTITSGRLSGEGVVRHRDEMCSDDFLVEAAVGAKDAGRTRLVTCGSASFSSFYALEVESGTNMLHIIKGRGSTALLDGGIFSATQRFASVSQSVIVGDKVGVWWDRQSRVVRAFLNDVEVTSLPVPTWEIPHGPGFRYWGVAQGVAMVLGTLKGVEFTSIAAEDV